MYYAVLGAGGSLGSQLFDDLTKDSLALFYQASAALPLIGYAILERVSSLMSHLAWGYLAVISAVTGRRAYLGLALPMGLVDFFVPISSSTGLEWSEALFFAFSAGCLAVAFFATAGKKEGDYYLFELGGPEQIPRLIDDLVAEGVKSESSRK